MYLRRSAVQPAAPRRSATAGPLAGRCRRRCMGSVRWLSGVRRLHAQLARRSPARAERRRHAVGDRQLPQHLPCRRHPAGSRVLDPQRHHLGEVQPDAQLSWRAVHQCARDADLVQEEPAAAALHLQLPGDEGGERRPSDAQRLGATDLHRRRAHRAGRGEAAHHPEARGVAVPDHPGQHQSGGSHPRPILRHRHDGCRGAAAGAAGAGHRARRRIRRRGTAAHRRDHAAGARGSSAADAEPATSATRRVRHAGRRRAGAGGCHADLRPATRCAGDGMCRWLADAR